MRKNFNSILYFIADPSLCRGRAVEDVVAAALRGGVTMMQYRDKSQDKNEILQQAKILKKLCESCHIPFLINDHVDIAREIDADGVHLGQGDMDPAEARCLLGPDKIIGLTAFTEKQIGKVDPALIDYIGTGPVYPTKTDKGKPVLGVQKFAELIQHATVPVVGIGGVTPENAPAVLDAGAAGVAVMRAISEADDPEAAARRLRQVLSF